jgi:DNA-binding XRE family transcriptional regulator
VAAQNKITEQDYRLGRRIQKIRKEVDLTQEKLAERVGVTTTFIGYVETGYRKPNLKMIYKIARALGVKVKDIFPF